MLAGGVGLFFFFPTPLHSFALSVISQNNFFACSTIHRNKEAVTVKKSRSLLSNKHWVSEPLAWQKQWSIGDKRVIFAPLSVPFDLSHWLTIYITTWIICCWSVDLSAFMSVVWKRSLIAHKISGFASQWTLNSGSKYVSQAEKPWSPIPSPKSTCAWNSVSYAGVYSKRAC